MFVYLSAQTTTTPPTLVNIMDSNMPEFVLFGDSITEWSFDTLTEGFGLFLEKKYEGKAVIVNEGGVFVRDLSIAASEG